MFSYLYHSFIFDPLYNGLIFLMDFLPWIDAGMAIVIFTIIVRLILFPLSKKAIVTQIMMKKIEPEINKIKNSMVNDRQGQALKMMALYKEKGISPFSSFFFLLIQLPIIFALYSIFINSGLPDINTSILYSFIKEPIVDMDFLGIVDIGMKNIPLAIIAAIAQFAQLHYSVGINKNKNDDKSISNPKKEMNQMDIAQNMTKNMKYVFPVIIFVISYQYASVVALYFIVSSLFTLAQELYVKKKLSI